MDYKKFKFTNSEIKILETLEPYIERYEEKTLKSGKPKLTIKIHKLNFEKCKVLESIGFGFATDSTGHKKYSKNNVIYISTGKGGSSNAYGGANIDDLRECGVILWCESILQKKPIDNITEFKYSVCGAKKITPAVINAFLSENSDWNDSCEKSAKTIMKNIYKTGYIFHHKDDVFESLKSQGKKLSKLAADKWNPADIFITSKNNIPTFNDLFALNSEINKFNEILPVSLKKGATDALAGAIALSHFYKGNYPRASSFNDKFINQLKSIVRNIGKSSKINKLIQVRKATKENSFNLIISKIVTNDKLSQSWFKSIPPIIAFLEDIAKKNINLNDTINKIVQICLSKAPESSNFYKVMGADLEVFNNHPADVKLEKCILSLNGDIDLKMEVSITMDDETKKWKLQCRSKGSAPQFILVPSTLGNPKNGEYDIPISKIEF